MSWTKKLDLRGNGELYIGSSGTSRVFHDGYHPDADTLTTARTIAGTSFNGSANIDISYDNLANLPTLGTAAAAASTDFVAVTGDTMTGVLNVQNAIQVSDGTFADSNRRNIYLDSFNAGGGAGIFFRDGFTYNASITTEDHNGSSADGICISGYDGVSFSTGSNNKLSLIHISEPTRPY